VGISVESARAATPELVAALKSLLPQLTGTPSTVTDVDVCSDLIVESGMIAMRQAVARSVEECCYASVVS